MDVRELDMIETYNIVTGKYQPCVAPTSHKGSINVTRRNDLRFEKYHVNTIYESLVSLTGW